MAEALTRQIAGDWFDVASAGTAPRSAVHPIALAVLAARHVSVVGLVPKDITVFAGQSFDYVITTCDRAQEQCPVFPGAEMIHWSFPDPAEVEPDRQRKAFEEVFTGLSQRIRLLLVVNQRAKQLEK